MDIIDDIIRVMRERGLNPTSLARSAAVPQPTVSRTLRRVTSPELETLQKLCAFLGLPAPMTSVAGEGSGLVSIVQSGALPVTPAIPSYTVPVFEAVASMGLGMPQPDADTVVDNIRLTKSWVDSHLPSISNPSNLAVLSAYGDSMAPTFADGDLLLVDRGVDSIKIDAVYVLALNGELYVKRIQRRITDGAVVIKSDNPLYDPVTVQNGDREGLSVLGRVVWAWNGRKL